MPPASLSPIGVVHQRFAAVARGRLLLAWGHLVQILFMQGHRVPVAINVDRDDTIFANACDFTAHANLVAFGDFPNHQNYMAQEAL